MKNFYNKILDIINVIISKLSIVLIVLLLGLIIYSRLDKLFQIGFLSENNLIDSKLNTKIEEPVDNGPAKVVYRGELPSDDEEVLVENNGKKISFEIMGNQSPEQVAKMLKDVGLISDPPSLILQMEGAGLLDSLKPGSYEVNDNILNRELIAVITGTDYAVEDSQENDKSNDKPGEDLELVTFEILEGQSLEEVSNTLKDVKLIQDTQTFINLVENANLRDDVKVGVYRLPKNIKNIDLIESITIATQE